MYFHHLHFYVKDTSYWNQWFSQKLAFQPQSAELQSAEPQSVEPQSAEPQSAGLKLLTQGGIEIRLSAPKSGSAALSGPVDNASQVAQTQESEVAEYLKQHPPGLVDIALATESFTATLSRALQQGAQLLKPVSQNSTGQRQCQIQGWKHLRHTLIEVSSQWVRQHQGQSQTKQPTPRLTNQRINQPWLQAIDHVVMNVARGDLSNAVSWYQKIFGLERSQAFEINTARSGLRSQVLVHPDGSLQLPINEPTSANSQVQEFLDHNRGAGIQHVALRSHNAVGAIAHFRQQGLDLIEVPDTYYQDLSQRSDCPLPNLSDLEQQRLLIDWPQGGQQGMLLQTFTQPVFAEPTFFFEIIERRTYQDEGRLKSTQGFGEGNFQALFEAIERSQLERGSLSN